MAFSFAELGSFSFCYRTSGVHGMGISASSNFVVLHAASQIYLKKGPPLCRGEVAEAALRAERRLAFGRAVAADDVYPITHGGVVIIRTAPNRGEGDVVSEFGAVDFERVQHDPRWIAEHVLVAINPNGERHDAPDLLDHLFDERERERGRRFVREFSRLAEQAAAAISAKDVNALGDAMDQYRSGFAEWTKQAYLKGVRDISDTLMKKLPKHVRSWKPPGGGASESLIVLVNDPDHQDAVISFFADRKWHCFQALVTSGLGSELARKNTVRFTAGHRLDFVGAADLGQDHKIGEPGVCCSCAIEPRSEIVLKISPSDPRHPLRDRVRA